MPIENYNALNNINCQTMKTYMWIQYLRLWGLKEYMHALRLVWFKLSCSFTQQKNKWLKDKQYELLLTKEVYYINNYQWNKDVSAVLAISHKLHSYYSLIQTLQGYLREKGNVNTWYSWNYYNLFPFYLFIHLLSN